MKLILLELRFILVQWWFYGVFIGWCVLLGGCFGVFLLVVPIRMIKTNLKNMGGFV